MSLVNKTRGGGVKREKEPSHDTTEELANLWAIYNDNIGKHDNRHNTAERDQTTDTSRVLAANAFLGIVDMACVIKYQQYVCNRRHQCISQDILNSMVRVYQRRCQM